MLVLLLLLIVLSIEPSLGLKKHLLQGVHLVIGVNGIPGRFSDLVREGNGSSYRLEGPTRQLLDYVAEMGRISYSIVLVNNVGLESIRDDLVSKKYDFCANFNPPIYVEGMDWSAFIWDEPWRILRPVPRELSRLLAFIHPFEPTVWLYFLVTTAAVIILLSAFAMAYDRQIPASMKQERTRQRTFYEFCGSYTMLILNVVTNKGGTNTTRANLSFRLLFGLWLLTVVVLVNGFASIVTSSMTVPRMEPVVQSYDDIANERQRGVTIIGFQNLSYTKLVLEAKSGPLKAFGDQLRRRPEAIAKDYIDLFQKLSSGKHVLPFMETFLYRFISFDLGNTRKCRLQVSDQLDFKTGLHGTGLSCYPMQKNGPFNEALNEIFIQLAETGLHKFWMYHSFKLPHQCLVKSNSKAKVAPIPLADLVSAFFILGVGTASSFFVFLVELVVFRYLRYPINNAPKSICPSLTHTCFGCSSACPESVAE